MTRFLQFALIGLGSGACYALLAQGTVLIYRGSGIVNFAQGAFAMLAAYVTFVELSGDRDVNRFLFIPDSHLFGDSWPIAARDPRRASPSPASCRSPSNASCCTACAPRRRSCAWSAPSPPWRSSSRSS